MSVARVAPDVVDVLFQFVEPAIAADGEADDVEPVVMHKRRQFLMRRKRPGAQIPAGAPEEFGDHR